MSLFKLAKIKIETIQKYLTTKNNKLFSPQKHIQRTALSTFANLVKDTKNGRIPRKISPNIEILYNNPKDHKLVRKLKQHIIDNTIDNKGHFNINKIEKYLKMGKSIDKPLSKIDNLGSLPAYSISGGIIGGAVGASRGYNKEEDHTKKKGAAISGFIKGGLTGSALASGLKFGVKKARSVTSPLSEVSDIYFKDNYWHNQLKKANNPFYNTIGKINSKLLTKKPKQSK